MTNSVYSFRCGKFLFKISHEHVISGAKIVYYNYGLLISKEKLISHVNKKSRTTWEK